MWRQGRDGRSEIAQEAVRRCDDGAWQWNDDVNDDNFDDNNDNNDKKKLEYGQITGGERGRVIALCLSTAIATHNNLDYLVLICRLKIISLTSCS